MVLRNINFIFMGNNLFLGCGFFYYRIKIVEIVKIFVKFLFMGQDIKMLCNWSFCLEILIIIVLKIDLVVNEKIVSQEGLYNFI